MENRKGIYLERDIIKLSNITKIISNNKESLCVIQGGQNLVIVGNNINITEYNKDTGIFSASGDIIKIEYKKDISPKSFLKKIFK